MLTSPDFVQGPLQPVPPAKVPDSKPSVAIGDAAAADGRGHAGEVTGVAPGGRFPSMLDSTLRVIC